MIGIYVFLFGSFFGAVLTGLLSDAVGTRAALTIIVLPSTLIGGALIALGARYIRRDMSLVVEELREEQDERTRMQQSDAVVPVLQVRNLDFSYGKVQVLFDVSFDVHQGETLALLGTNGAGKSTLLRVISGLGVADRGVVRLQRSHGHLRGSRAAGPDRHRAAHRRRRDLRAADRGGEPAHGRVPLQPQGAGTAHRQGGRAVPDAPRALRHAGPGPVGRPAADARPGDGARARARGADHRRAVARARADRRAAGARGGATAEGRRA